MRAGRGLTITGWVLVGLGVICLGAGSFWGFRGYEAVSAVGASMLPTYAPGDHLAIEKSDGGDIHRGDVVMLRAPGRYGGSVLRRVIALGGDHLVFAGGQLVLNGKPLTEPYLKDGSEGPLVAYDVLVPVGRMFTLGDNRSDSVDSRFFLSDHSGTLPRTVVRGKVLTDDRISVLVGGGILIGTLLALTGTGIAIAGRVVRRRAVTAGVDHGQSSSFVQPSSPVRR